jgi:DNA ligase D-like protein (predicted 3'-phosphoesterase)
MSDDALRAYLAKRNLDVSGEPGGGEPGGRPRFVIQRHDASSLHFDFRLEVDGVLKSWAVPEGPSTDPRDKRLARRPRTTPRLRRFRGPHPGRRVRRWPAATELRSVLSDRTNEDLEQ